MVKLPRLIVEGSILRPPNAPRRVTRMKIRHGAWSDLQPPLPPQISLINNNFREMSGALSQGANARRLVIAASTPASRPSNPASPTNRSPSHASSSTRASTPRTWAGQWRRTVSLRKFCRATVPAAHPMHCPSSPACDHHWVYDFRVNRKRYRNTTETANKQQAKKFEAQERSRVLERRHQIRQQPDITLRAVRPSICATTPSSTSGAWIAIARS